MPQSLAQLLTHVIFSTKHRQPLISADHREEMNRYLAGILRSLQSPAIEVRCVADHVHILCCLSRNIALAKLVQEVKTGSSKWIKTVSADLAGFHWQAGYGAFSVSQSNVDSVRAYILSQEDHHRSVTFQDELRAFFRKHNIEFDERHVWD